MRSSFARSAPFIAPLVGALLLGACGYVPDDLAPGIPPDFQRRGPPSPDGSVIVVRTDLCDASVAQSTDAAFPDAQVETPDAFIADDSGPGCAFIECNPGFLCCASDSRCYPVSCFDCCGFFPDTGVPAPPFPF